MMLTKYIKMGDRVEMLSLRRISKNPDEEKKVYQSKVLDIISEDKIEITMPIEKTKLILLPTGGEFELVFYTRQGLYQCFAKIADRYKSSNIYILAIDITSNLQKYQRREYYRYNCSLEMWNRSVVENETESAERKKISENGDEQPVFERNVMVDISGGGARFIGVTQYEPHSCLLCKFKLPVLGKIKEYEIMSRVLTRKPLENRLGAFEHRIQFVEVSNDAREEIIKFIFEEERKNRRKEQG